MTTSVQQVYVELRCIASPFVKGTGSSCLPNNMNNNCEWPWVWIGFPPGSASKESACNVGDLGLILGWEDLLEKVKVKSLSCVRLFATPWTVAYQASLSMGFSRQEYWSELPFPSPGDLPDPGTEPRSPAL